MSITRSIPVKLALAASLVGPVPGFSQTVPSSKTLDSAHIHCTVQSATTLDGRVPFTGIDDKDGRLYLASVVLDDGIAGFIALNADKIPFNGTKYDGRPFDGVAVNVLGNTLRIAEGGLSAHYTLTDSGDLAKQPVRKKLWGLSVFETKPAGPSGAQESLLFHFDGVNAVLPTDVKTAKENRTNTQISLSGICTDDDEGVVAAYTQAAKTGGQPDIKSSGIAVIEKPPLDLTSMTETLRRAFDNISKAVSRGLGDQSPYQELVRNKASDRNVMGSSSPKSGSQNRPQ